jgi:hypothetical protein
MTVSLTATRDSRTLRQVELDDELCGKIYAADIFVQFTCPCWMTRVALMLPPETVNTKDVPKEKIHTMPIRTMEASRAPARMFVRGGISSKSDYVELLATLNNLKPDFAAVVDMDPKSWVKDDGTPMDKPEITFANSLRRRFEVGGMPITAYMSGKLQVTVRRLTALEQKERASGKGKRKKS